MASCVGVPLQLVGGSWVMYKILYTDSMQLRTCKNTLLYALQLGRAKFAHNGG